MKKGCLVIHGLTGTPANLAPVIKVLQERGFAIEAPLLKGHGNSLETLSRSRWRDWYGSVLESLETLSKKVDAVYFAGLSMGALLGLKLAIDQGERIKALALLGVPFLARPLFRFIVIPGVRYTPLRLFIRSVAKNFEKSVLDPEGREEYRAHSLARMPGPGVYETQKLKKTVARDLKKITQPLLLLHGVKDHIADPKGIFQIRKQVSSQMVDIVLLKNSAHVLTMDHERWEAARRVGDFFSNV